MRTIYLRIQADCLFWAGRSADFPLAQEDVTSALNARYPGVVFDVTELTAPLDMAYIEAGINETLNILTRATAQMRTVMDELRLKAKEAENGENIP